MHYTFTDHQGSLSAYTTGSSVTHLSYDAWGRRNAADGSYDNLPAQATDRGYTGHEHLDAFGLINMNGRLYDPMLGRMLSPDIVVQQTDYTQSYNRYSYCFNNPLRFTDPTGWVSGDFYWKGKYIGSDGIDDGKVYLLRNGIDSGLSNRELKEARNFIKENSGNAEAFAKNSVAYDTSIAIEGSESVRKKMFEIVSKDNGKGGTSERNNREYGGWIENGKVQEATPGEVADLSKGDDASINLPQGYSTFHSHPSGTLKMRDRTITEERWYEQEPSRYTKNGDPGDILNAGEYTHYVFGMSNKYVYIYNKDGVQTAIRIKSFIKLGK